MGPEVPIEQSNHVIPTSIEQNLAEKTYGKRRSGAMELQTFIQSHANPDVSQIIQRLVDHFIRSTDTTRRKGGLVGLAALSISIKEKCVQHLEELLPPILSLLLDHESRVRYYACESLFNITKVVHVAVVPYFCTIYSRLCDLFGDLDVDVRNGAAVLDKLLHEAVARDSSARLDLNGFVNVIEDRLPVRLSAVRMLNVSWIVFIDSLPQYSLIDRCPVFIPFFFDMLSDSAEEVRRKANASLRYFLKKVVRDEFVPWDQSWKSEIVRVLFKQCYGTVESHAEALECLYEIARVHRLDFIKKFPQIVGIVLDSFVSSDKAILEKTRRLNVWLMDRIRDNEFSGDIELRWIKALSERLRKSHSGCLRVVMDWIILLLKNSPVLMKHYVNMLKSSLFDLLLDKSHDTFQLALHPILGLMQMDDAMFELIFHDLLKLFLEDRDVLRDVGIDLISELAKYFGSERILLTVSNAIQEMCSSSRYNRNCLDGISFLIQAMHFTLMTSKSFRHSRKRLERAKQDFITGEPDGKRLFEKLFESWSHDFPSALSLCLFCKFYRFAYVLMLQFNHVEVTVGLITGLCDLIEQLESPLFSDIRMDMMDASQQPFLLRVLCGLLLIIPQNAQFETLSNRLGHELGSFPGRNFIQVNERHIIDFDHLLATFLVNQNRHNSLRIMALGDFQLDKR